MILLRSNSTCIDATRQAALDMGVLCMQSGGGCTDEHIVISSTVAMCSQTLVHITRSTCSDAIPGRQH